MAELEALLPYDTGLMRALAQTLKGRAGTLSALADEVTGAGRSLVFDGPAGDRVREVLGSCAGTVNAAVQELTDAAARVLSSADDVDRQNAAIRAHNDAVLRSMPPLEAKLIREGV